MGHSPGWDSVAGIRCKGVTCLKPRSKANRSGRRVHAENPSRSVEINHEAGLAGQAAERIWKQ